MLKILFFTLLFALLGAAGYWWFQEWYGLLTAAGLFALRVGPMFLWRVILRFIRREILNAAFKFLPSFIKQPVRALRARIGKVVQAHIEVLRARWKSSWLLRALILVPPIAISCVIAYDAEGVVEFIALFPIPFLTAALFPEGFWTLTGAYLMRWLAAHGLENVALRVLALIPKGLRARYSARKFQVVQVLAGERRAANTRVWSAFSALRKKMGGDTKST